jgi:hypothetical protein
VGSWVAIIDEMGKVITTRQLPTSPALIKWTLFFGNSLAHSSVMMRRSLIENTEYTPEILYSQDYDLWARLSDKTRLANIPRVLSLSRKHEQMISVQHRDAQRQMGDKVRRYLIENLLGGMVPDPFFLTFRIANQKQILETEKEVQEVISFIERIHRWYIAKQDDLDSTEKDVISMDVARRIVDIGLLHSEKFPLLTIKTLLQGLMINCRVLRPSDIKIVARNITRYIRTETERVTDEMPSAPNVGAQRSSVNIKILSAVKRLHSR